MADKPKISWGDISAGLRPDVDRVRTMSTKWFADTVSMVDQGYLRFWKRRGLEPPRVSTTMLESSYIPTALDADGSHRDSPCRSEADRRRVTSHEDAILDRLGFK